jgi:hypothetical protein
VLSVRYKLNLYILLGRNSVLEFPMPGDITGLSYSWGNKYRYLAFQVGKVSKLR